MSTAVCPSCKNTLNIPAGGEGKQLRCPVCKHQFIAPSGSVPLAKPAPATSPSPIENLAQTVASQPIKKDGTFKINSSHTNKYKALLGYIKYIRVIGWIFVVIGILNALFGVIMGIWTAASENDFLIVLAGILAAILSGIFWGFWAFCMFFLSNLLMCFRDTAVNSYKTVDAVEYLARKQ